MTEDQIAEVNPRIREIMDQIDALNERVARHIARPLREHTQVQLQREIEQRMQQLHNAMHRRFSLIETLTGLVTEREMMPPGL